MREGREKRGNRRESEGEWCPKEGPCSWVRRQRQREKGARAGREGVNTRGGERLNRRTRRLDEREAAASSGGVHRGGRGEIGASGDREGGD